MRWLVVFGSLPLFSISSLPFRKIYAHPPGPGFPKHAPSVNKVTLGRVDIGYMVSTLSTLIPSPYMTVTRIEVRPSSGNSDPRGEAALRRAESVGLQQLPTEVDTTAVYLLEGDLDEDAVRQISEKLLSDPVTEEPFIGAAAPHADTMIEVHPLPGVMDPDAQSVELAIRRLLGVDVKVQTGCRYDFHGIESSSALQFARKCLANTVVHEIHSEPYHPEEFPHGHDHDMAVPEVPISKLSDDELETLSREGHLFLDLEEMQTIQSYYRDLAREPREIELETLAQTWSEHCVHKTLKVDQITSPTMTAR